MHGHLIAHSNIARRQVIDLVPTGFFDPFSSNSDPLSGIFGHTTSTTTDSSSSISSSSASEFPSIIPLTSSVSSSSSVSSTPSSSSSGSSSTPLTTYPAPSPTPTPTPTPPTQTFSTSSSSGDIITITSTVSASASADAVAVAPKSFLQNKPLAAGVFTVVGIIGLVILILIGTVWIRGASRRRLNREALDASTFDPAAIVRDEKFSSLENLRRVNSTGSSRFSHTVGQASLGRGYSAPPVAFLAPQGYNQAPPYHGQPPEGTNFDNRYPAYLPTRGLDPIYTAASTLPPHVNDIAPAPSTGSQFNNEISPIHPSNQSFPLVPQGRSLLNSPPVSPSGFGENAAGHKRGSNSYPRTLDMQEMPVAPPLPPKFGSDEDEDEDGEAYGGIGSDHSHEISHSLQVANQ